MEIVSFLTRNLMQYFLVALCQCNPVVISDTKISLPYGYCCQDSCADGNKLQGKCQNFVGDKRLEISDCVCVGVRNSPNLSVPTRVQASVVENETLWWRVFDKNDLNGGDCKA